MSLINPVVDALAEVLEPWTDSPATTAGVRIVTADSGSTVDLNCRRPKEYDSNTLYLWPTQHVHSPEGAGNPPEDRENFGIQCIYVIEREGEEPQLQARRDVSDALDARAAAYTDRVAANRVHSPFWQHIQAVVQHDTVVTFGVRGVGLLVTGYRYVN